jgi:hypothetical protein
MVFIVCDVLKFSIKVLKKLIENFNTSQTMKIVASYTILIYLHTFVGRMGSHLT